MDQMNVQRWASSLRQFHRNHIQNTDHCQLTTAATSAPTTNNNTRRILSHNFFAPTSSEFSTTHGESLSPSSCVPPFVTDVCVGNQNGVRNASTTTKIREIESLSGNHFNDQYSFTLNFPSPSIKTKKDSNRSLKSQFYTFDMTTKDDENLTSSLDISPCDNQSSTKFSNDSFIHRISKNDNNNNLSDHHDTDALSDAGTYVIDDDDESEQKLPTSSSPFKRYTNETKNRHGTFDIHAMISSAPHTISRPVVDSAIPKDDSPLSSSSNSSLSSLHSFPTDNEDDILEKSSVNTKQRPNTLLIQQSTIPLQNQIKPAEAFVISPTKFSSNTITNGSRRKPEVPSKLKSSTTIVLTKDSNLEIPTIQSISFSSPPLSTCSDQNDTDKYLLRPQQQIPTRNLKSSSQTSESISSTPKVLIRPHTAISDQISSSSQRTSANIPSNRSQSTSVAINDDNDQTILSNPNLTKVYMNKSFSLRKQHSNVVPPTSRPIQQQAIAKPSSRQPLKSTTSIPASSITSLTGQTNRAVELRRARAQARIEELSQRTKKQLHKTEHQNDLMSASWHSNASSTNKKDYVSLRPYPRTTGRTTIAPQQQDLLSTRTISSSSHHRASSASPKPTGETTSKYRKDIMSNVTDEQQYKKINGNSHSREGERCDSLRDNGQRLAIKLIQLSSGILEKLNPNDDINERELQQLVDKLQTVNQTLSSIDASLSGPTSDDTFT